MTRRGTLLLLTLLAAGLGAAGYAYHRQQVGRQAMLAKFEQLDNAVQQRNARTARESAKLLRQLELAVCRNRNQIHDLKVIAEGRQIQARTLLLADTLRAVRRRLLAFTGNEAAAALRHPDAAGAVAEFMLGGPAPTQAERLKKQLDAYGAYIRAYVPDASPLAEPGGGEPQLVWPGPAADGFGTFYFDDTPAAAALATLTRLEAQLQRYETEALQMKSSQISTGMMFVSIGAAALPQSTIVAPGSIYEAKLFLTSSSGRYFVSEMRLNGKLLPKAVDGLARVQFRVPAPRPGQPDTVRAQWQGSITARTDCRDTTFQLTVPYLIIKPAVL